MNMLTQDNNMIAVENKLKSYFTKGILSLTEIESIVTELLDNDLWAVYISDSNGYPVFVNKAHTMLFGSVPPPNYSVFNDPIIKQQGVGHLLEQLKSGQGVQFPDIYYNANTLYPEMPDSNIWLQTIAFPIKDDEGKPYHYIFIEKDITKFKVAEERLRESENKYKRITENISDIVWTTDLELNTTYVSPSIINFSGETPEEHLKRSLYDKHPASSVEIIKNAYSAELLSEKGLSPMEGRSRLLEVKYIKADGSTIWVSLNVSFIRDESGNAIGLQGTSRDITHQKFTEQELIKAKTKAEESERLKTAFLANLSHEIRTPLNAIIGFSELLKSKYSIGKPEAQFAELIESNGHHLLNLLTNIIDYSKIEVGAMPIHYSKVQLDELLTQIGASFEPAVKAKGLTLNINHYHTPSLCIETDREKLTTILHKLIENAIRYTPAGAIEVCYTLLKNEKIQASMPKHDGPIVNSQELFIHVNDTGVGIPDYMQKQIFRRFERIINGKLPIESGTGLGLTIAKAYVKMLGGNIWVKSTEGKGSTFYFTLPCTTSEIEDNDKKLINNEYAT